MDSAGLPNVACTNLTNAPSDAMPCTALADDGDKVGRCLGIGICHSVLDGSFDPVNIVYCSYVILTSVSVNVAVNPAFQSSEMDSNDVCKWPSANTCAGTATGKGGKLSARMPIDVMECPLGSVTVRQCSANILLKWGASDALSKQ